MILELKCISFVTELFNSIYVLFPPAKFIFVAVLQSHKMTIALIGNLIGGIYYIYLLNI